MNLIENNVAFVAYFGTILLHLYLVANPTPYLNTSLIYVIPQFLPTSIIAYKVYAKEDDNARSIYTGLLLSTLGVNYLLNEEMHQFNMTGSLAAFLVGHLYFVSGLNHSSTKKSEGSRNDWITPISTYFGVYAVISYFILPSTSFELKIPVFLYGTAIASMLWKAIDGWRVTGHLEGVFATLALGLSDFILAYSELVEPVNHRHLMFMVTYYIAQILISKFALK
ncbi:hypothetical protein HDV02_001617 [Globomyces sp. JEL0801]|nr:hypothetical protein HDV02_001617 [Globomyces sp. JEL0801]